MISIGIPFYNAEAYLEDAIKSVLAQTFQDWELILVDDGSSDGSLNIAKKYEQLDSRVRVISDGLNKKLPTRLNEIIKEAKFNLIARMDADDLMDIERLEKQYIFLNQNPEYDLVTTGMYSIGRNNEVLGKRLPENRIMEANEILGGVTNLLHASLLATKEWCLRNPYREDNALAEDYELWLSSAIKGDLKYYVIQEPLYYYREVENVKKVKMIRGYTTQIEIIKRYSKGVISDSHANKIIFKFNLKKIVVIFLDLCKLMIVLEKIRVSKISDMDKSRYLKNLRKIQEIGLTK